MASSVYGNQGVKRLDLLFRSNVIVAVAAFWVNFCLRGVLRSNAVLYKAFVDIYEVDRQHAAWPSGIFGFFMCVTGAASGFLSHWTSIRNLAMIGAALASASVSICSLASQMPHIVFLYGALQGIGMGLIVPLTHVIINQNFTKYRACALGVAYSGSSIGTFIFPALSNYLLMEFGLQGTFLLLGGIMGNSLIGTLLFRTPKSSAKNSRENITNSNNDQDSKVGFYGTPEASADKAEKSSERQYCEVQTSPGFSNDVCFNAPNSKSGMLTIEKDEKKSSMKLAMEVLSSPYFLIVSIVYAVYFSNSAIFLMVALDFAKDRDLSIHEGVFLISAFSIGDFVGRLSFGWIADTQCVKRNILVRCYLVAMGIITAVLPICPNNSLHFIIILLGVVNGSVIVNHSVLLNEYLGIQKLPLAMGFSTCFIGVTAFLRPIIIGEFRDRNNSYNYMFLFVGSLQILITILWFLESLIKVIHRKHAQKDVLKPIV